MDVKSAFCVVVHPNLMRKLYNSGIDSLNWLMINNLHHESQTAVKWQERLSSTYTNQQGVLADDSHEISYLIFFSKIGKGVAKFVVCCSRDWRFKG